MHSYSRPSREVMVFASGTVSPVMCSSDWQQKDDKKGQAEDKVRRGQRQSKAKRRPQQGGRFLFKLFLPGALGLSGVISHDISRDRYIVTSYPISCDITRYDVSG